MASEVYLVSESIPYEGDEVMAVFASLEAAVSYAQKEYDATPVSTGPDYWEADIPRRFRDVVVRRMPLRTAEDGEADHAE